MRRWLPTAVSVAALLGAAGTALAMTSPEPPAPVSPPRSPSVAPSQTVAPSPPPSASSPPVGPDLAAVLRLPGTPPVRGGGAFRTAPGTGPTLGRAGRLRTFAVAVERGIGEDAAAFAAAVEQTLGDDRSWPGGGDLRLRRVSRNPDFTVYLASREKAAAMCQAGGTNIRVGGRPYTSCRTTGRVIINLDRWRLSSPRFTAADVPLADYRHYVINHEVGHELGHRHQGCPRRGGPAPVMVQQTLRLLGCEPYAWPRRAGRAWTGPRL